MIPLPPGLPPSPPPSLPAPPGPQKEPNSMVLPDLVIRGLACVRIYPDVPRRLNYVWRPNRLGNNVALADTLKQFLIADR